VLRRTPQAPRSLCGPSRRAAAGGAIFTFVRYRVRVLFLATLASWSGSAARAQDAITFGSLAGYANLQTAGVLVTAAGDVNQNATALLEWRSPGRTFRSGHPLARIDATHFAGSVFWLARGRAYDVRVTLQDPEGVSGSASRTVRIRTRDERLADPGLRTLYVSPGGNDSGSGTVGSPFRTVQRAADLAQAGDLILVRPGVYRESVTMARSGTASQPIVFRGDGPGVVLDGADEAIAAGVAWTASGSGVYSRVTGFPTDHVVSEAGRLYRYGTLADLQALGAGPPGGFTFDGTLLQVKLADGSSPAGHTLHVARPENAVVLDGVAWVRVENLEIRHYGSGGYGKGVYLRYAADCVVRGNRIHEVESAGVWAKGGERHRIEDNEIWDTSIFDWPWPRVKGSTAENNGVVFTDDLGRGHVVRRNTIHGTFNGIGGGGSTAPTSGTTNEIDIHDNVLYQHLDDAVEPEGYGSNVRIWNNRIRDVHMAFSVAPMFPGPIYLVGNVAWRFGNTRTSQQDGYTASALKINNGYAETTGLLYLYHNTFLTDAPGTNALTLMTPGSARLIRARNNVFAGTRYVLEKENAVPLDLDRDLVYTTDAGRFVKWEGVPYSSLAALRAGNGQELSGMSFPPQLVNPPAGDFTPTQRSPLVDRGLRLPGINDGYWGRGPDIGAVEVTRPPVY